MSKPQLLVVGWDAADWSVINPLLEQGKMPALATLMERGFSGNLASLQPMLSPLLWTSIATGVRPHEHGILNFVETDKAGNPRAIRGTSRKSPTFWEILHSRGIKSNVIGWWPSHPAQDSGGIQVSNFFGKSADDKKSPLKSHSVYPSELEKQLDELRVHVTEMTPRILAPFFLEAGDLDGKDAVVSSVGRIVAQASTIHAATTEAMQVEDWDVTAVYLDAMDHFKHLAMKYHPPKANFISEEEFKKYRGIVEAGYRFHDMMLDRLLSLAGQECHVLLVSDHGFASGEERVADTPDLPGGPAAEHHPFGILVGAGPHWKSQTVHGHSLLDICPAILQLFGCPVDRNMSGRVPLEWWKIPERVSYVDGYRIPELLTDRASVDSSDIELLDELEKLGYIDLPTDKVEARRSIDGDSRYNKVVSLLDSGLWSLAKEESIRLCMDHPSDPRFAHQLLGIRLMTHDVEFESHLKEVSERFPSPSSVYFEGMNALRKGLYGEALNKFDQVLTSSQLNASLVLTMARVLFQSGRENESLMYLERVSNHFSRNAQISDLSAEIYWNKYKSTGENSTLQKALSHTLEAIEKQFYLPNSHKRLAEIGAVMEEWEVSANAYQIFLMMAPFNKEVIQEAKHALVKSGRIELAEKLKDKDLGEKQIIVTGWPRSGTSLMMNMLSSGGILPYEDGTRTSDENNRHGYFEHERIKQTMVDSSWLEESKDRAVKVVLPLLKSLPGNRQYILIWMQRPLTEVILSQEVMAGKKRDQVMKYFPFEKALKMEAEERAVKEWVEKANHIQCLEVDFKDCINRSQHVAEKVQAFMSNWGIQLNSEKMIQAVDKDQYRQKL